LDSGPQGAFKEVPFRFEVVKVRKGYGKENQKKGWW
jgi:hypothetical protein